MTHLARLLRRCGRACFALADRLSPDAVTLALDTLYRQQEDAAAIRQEHERPKLRIAK